MIMKLTTNMYFYIELFINLIMILSRFTSYYFITYIFDNNNYGNNLIIYYLTFTYLNLISKNLTNYVKENNNNLINKKNKNEIIKCKTHGRIISIPIFIIEILCLTGYLFYNKMNEIAIILIFYILVNIYDIFKHNNLTFLIKSVFYILLNYLLILQHNESLFFWIILSIDSITNNISLYDDTMIIEYVNNYYKI